ncbi:phosphatase PAP2 family protein [Candidatus Saccharibacteria bacterium]|nr:phosphatase PAP2 family protein [Candidatus Saccharibacteria bacterium]
MQWEKATDIILITALLVLGVFAALGLYQLITRKSFKKVDRNLLAFIPTFLIMAIIYIVFEKFLVINVRPDGSGEPSFPSTHTMIVATVFFITMLNLKKYVRQKPLRIILDIVMLILIPLTAVGRVLANKHWPTDVLGGIIFSMILATIYYVIAKPSKKSKNHKKEQPDE